MPFCKAENSRGKPCRSPAGSDSEYCFFHNPDLKDVRREAQRKGGRQGLRWHVMPTPPPSDFDLTDPNQIVRLASFIANRILRGELDPKSAYAITQLADCALRAHNAIELTRRVEHLEQLGHIEQHSPWAPSPDLIFEDADPITSQRSCDETTSREES